MKKLAIGVLAHVDSGKTTLSEALMYCSGNISKLGRVDHKSSFLDTFALERERGITIFSKQAVLKYSNTEFTLLDTPGHIDFSAEAERTLQVLDYAILVISGTDGVQSHTTTLWRLLSRYNIPTFIYINKMDLQGAEKQAVLQQLKSKLSDNCTDFNNIDEAEFKEAVALCDEDLLSKYYDEQLCTQDIISAIKKRKVFPCYFGSALKLQGIDELLQGLDVYTEQPNYSSEFGAKVYKITEDNQKNRLTFLKVTGGNLKVKDVLIDKNTQQGEKVNQIRIYSGDRFTPVDTACSGSICAVTGITFAKSGDGLGAEQDSPIPVLEPVLTYSVILPKTIDSHTALSKMRILEEEDPKLNVVWNENLGEIHIQLMGEIQLEILKSIINDRFGFSVEFGQGNIIYKETISNSVEGVGHFEPLRHYAEVHLLLEPAPNGSGVTFATNCKEDNLDRNWQRLILTHLQEKSHLGVLTGSPITDVKITLMSGKAHPKHTEGGDFRQATYKAVRQGLRSAESVLLEPVYEFTLEIPNENVGRAMSDIQRMYGSFSPPEVLGDTTTLTGTAPVATMGSYQQEVIQYTHGKGRLMCILKGYQPCHNSEEVIEKIGYNCDGDLANTCDSVFCSHGAGFNVKWDEVPQYMHLPSIFTKEQTLDDEPIRASDRVTARFSNYGADIFAEDRELMEIFEQTYGSIKRNTTAVKRPVKIDYGSQNKKTYKLQEKYTGPEYLLVDGYNVVHSWEMLKQLAKDNLDNARNRLINILCNYQGYKKCELILVFDAYRVKGKHREVERVNNINVVYTKEAETADMYIEKVTHKLAKNHKVRVVTSDGLEQYIILGHGALRVSSDAFLQEVRQAEGEIKQLIEEINSKNSRM
ncbi:MAG: translation factor GTPase family protein [Acutalibacteraceae bacterium]|nr:translation factor GTPase family protein [Acutalibacteraceae bacterium]